MQWIVGYEGLYKISKSGVVVGVPKYWRRKRKVLTIFTKCGYPCVNLWKNGKIEGKKVSRLVAEAYIPNNRNLPQVNHLDGNKNNSNVTNLEWCTHKENMAHAKRTGLAARGERIHSAKLKEVDVVTLRSLWRKKRTTELAKMFGVSRGNVYQIAQRNTWKHI